MAACMATGLYCLQWLKAAHLSSGLSSCFVDCICWCCLHCRSGCIGGLCGGTICRSGLLTPDRLLQALHQHCLQARSVKTPRLQLILELLHETDVD